MGRGKHPKKKKKNIYVKPPTDVSLYEDALNQIKDFISEYGYIAFSKTDNEKLIETRKIYQFCFDADKPDNIDLMRLIMRRKEKYDQSHDDIPTYCRQHDGIVANGRIKLKEMLSHEFADLLDSGYTSYYDSSYEMKDLTYKPKYEGLKRQITRIAKEKGLDTSLSAEQMKHELKRVEKEERRKKKIKKGEKKNGK